MSEPAPDSKTPPSSPPPSPVAKALIQGLVVLGLIVLIFFLFPNELASLKNLAMKILKLH